MSANEYVLNFCNKNLELFGTAAHQHFFDDPRVVVDEPPNCQGYCFECQYFPFAVYGAIGDRDEIKDDQWEFLQAGTMDNPGTTADLIELINRRILENLSP